MDIVDSILNGEYDDDLEDIKDAVKSRETLMSQLVFASLRVGDTVRISGGGRPQYLKGATAEVVEKRVSKVTILFPLDMGRHDPYRKFAGKRWIFPASLLEKVEVVDG